VLKKTHLLFLLSVVFALNLYAQINTDRQTIWQTALNYAEGWFERNAERAGSPLLTGMAKSISQTKDKKTKLTVDENYDANEFAGRNKCESCFG
jgi:hypothetical protein